MSDDEYEIPLRDQRMFGSGLKRKRIQFVSSTQSNASKSIGSRTEDEITAAEKYLAIVLGKRANTRPGSLKDQRHREEDVLKTGEHAEHEQESEKEDQLCAICSKPLSSTDTDKTHNNSLVHQICIQHSHPPSHIDRGRKGLAVLQSYGWDPDQRRGLGADGHGILHPIKARDNAARVGIGAIAIQPKAAPKPVRLDAGKIRKAAKDVQKHKDRLREAFYRDEKVERYLGELDYARASR